MKKICFISLKAYPLFNPKIESTFGGAEVQLFLLSKEIATNKKYDVNFIVADYGQQAIEKFSKVKVWKTFALNDSVVKKFLKFYFLFNKINADIYVLRTLTPQTGLISLYGKLFGKKVVYMIAHDKEVERAGKLSPLGFRKFLSNLTFKYSEIIFSQNSYQKETLLNNMGVDSLLLNSSYPIKEKLTRNPRDILWVGRSEYWKRPDIFIELAKKYKDQHFVMICPPSTNNKKYALEIEAKAKNISNLEFHSYIPFKEMDKFFNKSKIYITTSEAEGFQNTLIQATLNKVPILSLCVNPNNFITDSVCGFFCEDEIELLYKNFEILLKNKSVYKTMSENAYRYATTHHDIKKNSNIFLKYITSV